MLGKQLYDHQKKKRKFKIHTGSVFKMAFKIAKTPLKGKKNFFKVCLVGTLNLCLKMPKQMQKTRNQSDHPYMRKRQKTVKNQSNSYFVVFVVFGRFLSLEGSDSPLVFCILSGTLRHKFRVPTRHTLKKIFLAI